MTILRRIPKLQMALQKKKSPHFTVYYADQ